MQIAALGMTPYSAPRQAAQPSAPMDSVMIRGVVDEELAMVKRGELQKGCESIFLEHKEARGTVLMFHGYTAGPWQYRELAARIHDAGYNVFIPRMPGHGHVEADGTPTGKLLPDKKGWDTFVDRTHAMAAELNLPIQAVGLSGGGNVALRMGERHKLEGVAAMAPYLGGDLPKGALFALSDVIDRCTFGLFSKLILNHIPHNKNVKIPNDPTPHTQGSLGQARAMRRLGTEIKRVNCPVQLISTDGDLLSGKRKVGRLLERCDELRSAWHRFTRDEDVPHAMLSPLENKNAPSVEKVHDLVFQFVTR